MPPADHIYKLYYVYSRYLCLFWELIRMSYYQILGLEKEPFSTSPDPAFFYQSRAHRTALANLMIELQLKRGLSVILGDVGTGKTTLGRKLIQMLRERNSYLFHLILDPTYPSEEIFLVALTRTFGIEFYSSQPTILDLRESLERFLFRKGIQEGQTVVLIIDEAQKLNPLSLEILRILLNYETNEFKLMQLVLLAQMELMPHLNGMQNLLDRISLKYVLNPLNEEETKEMINFRLREAGYKARMDLFLGEAVKEIYCYTHGYPRQVAMICHKALKLLIMKRREVVDRELIHEIIHQEVKPGWNRVTSLRESQLT